jgi:hypothetical protein
VTTDGPRWRARKRGLILQEAEPVKPATEGTSELKAGLTGVGSPDLEAVMSRTVLAVLAGAVTALVLGFLIYGIALASFFATNVGSATGVAKDPPDLLWIGLAQIPLALLLTMAIDRWGENSKSLGGGAKVGAIFGFLIAMGIDFQLYGTMNVSNLTATVVDPFISMVLVAVVGAVIGMMLGRRAA